jgi:hypothetical protein
MSEWILPEVRAEIEQRRKKAQEQQMESEIELNIECNQANYVVIDSVVWGNSTETALGLCPNYATLFALMGADANLDDVAPYLLKYDNNVDFINWLNDIPQTNLRRLYIKSDLSIEKLRAHLRCFLRVKTEDGWWLYFRFYDPYVANCVFPNLTQEQVNEFFAPIDYLITEDVRINERRVFYLSADKELRIKTETINYVDNN